MSDWNLSLWPTPSLLSPGGYKLECFKSRTVQPWKVQKNKCVIKYNLIIFTVTIELGNALRWNYLSFLLHFRSNSSQSRWYFVVSSVHMMVDGLFSMVSNHPFPFFMDTTPIQASIVCERSHNTIQSCQPLWLVTGALPLLSTMWRFSLLSLLGAAMYRVQSPSSSSTLLSIFAICTSNKLTLPPHQRPAGLPARSWPHNLLHATIIALNGK